MVHDRCPSLICIERDATGKIDPSLFFVDTCTTRDVFALCVPFTFRV